jgi:hypothetical protein
MLTTREKALVASSPAIGVLLLTIGWNLWDHRADLRATAVRLLRF